MAALEVWVVDFSDLDLLNLRREEGTIPDTIHGMRVLASDGMLQGRVYMRRMAREGEAK